MFDEKAKQEVFEALSRDYISGLTLSGGDPLYYGNRTDITRLVKEVKKTFPDKTIWMYTGFVWEAVCSLEVMKFIDVLVDGEFIAAQKDVQLYWRGSTNQRVIDVPAALKKGEIVLHCQ